MKHTRRASHSSRFNTNESNFGKGERTPGKGILGASKFGANTNVESSQKFSESPFTGSRIVIEVDKTPLPGTLID